MRQISSNIPNSPRVLAPSQFKVWIVAARLRTLPLSMAGIITGNSLALKAPGFSWLIFFGALLTAISYQILSNFANDYGDGIKGTDNDKRLGPKRVLQQNWLSQKALYNGIIWTALIAFILSLSLIYGALGGEKLGQLLIFILLALLAIWAAYNYTVGDRAYGYYALGDLFVLVFFGGVAVGGSYFLQMKTLSMETLYFSIALGGLSVGVLNLNNLRDIENDKRFGKITLAGIMGFKIGIAYQFVLVLGSCSAVALALQNHPSESYWKYLPLLIVFPLSSQLFQLVRIKENQQIDSLLKPLALSTFGLSLLLFFTYWLLL